MEDLLDDINDDEVVRVGLHVDDETDSVVDHKEYEETSSYEIIKGDEKEEPTNQVPM